MKPSSARLRFSFFLLPLLFIATVAANPQCAQVDDRVTAPDGFVTDGSDDTAGGSKGGVSECVRACNDIARELRNAETDLHRANLTVCKGNSDCKREEAARHAAVMQQIAVDEQECKALCHEQGSGSGGQ